MTLNTATLRITPEILSLIAGIDAFKGAWRAIGRIAPERLSGLRRAATIESIGSFTTHDAQEVAGYAEAMEAVFGAYDDMTLTENHIRQLHRDLLAHSTEDERHRGFYKTLANHVEACDEAAKSLGVAFATATPFDTPRRMAELVAWAAGSRAS